MWNQVKCSKYRQNTSCLGQIYMNNTQLFILKLKLACCKTSFLHNVGNNVCIYFFSVCVQTLAFRWNITKGYVFSESSQISHLIFYPVMYTDNSLSISANTILSKMSRCSQLTNDIKHTHAWGTRENIIVALAARQIPQEIHASCNFNFSKRKNAGGNRPTPMPRT